MHEDVAGRRLRVSLGSFFQSGPAAAELLVDTVAPGRARARRARPWSSTPTPASGCSRPCVAHPDAARDRHRDVTLGGRRRPREPRRPPRRDRARRGRRLARAGRPPDRRRRRRPGPQRSRASRGRPRSSGRPHRCWCSSAVIRRRSAATPSCSCAAGYAPRPLRGDRHVPADDPRRGRVALRTANEGTILSRCSSRSLSSEVADAVARSRPVVALESTIFSNLGLPSPANREALNRCIAAIAVRRRGRRRHGRARRGAPASGSTRRSTSGSSDPPARWLNAILPSPWRSAGRSGRRPSSASLAVAASAGITVFATGGIGGVHRGAETHRATSRPISTRSRRGRSSRSAPGRRPSSISAAHWSTSRRAACRCSVGATPSSRRSTPDRPGSPVPHRVEDADEVARIFIGRARPRCRRPRRGADPRRRRARRGEAGRCTRPGPRATPTTTASSVPPSRRSCSPASPRRREATAFRPTSRSRNTTRRWPRRSRSRSPRPAQTGRDLSLDPRQPAPHGDQERGALLRGGRVEAVHRDPRRSREAIAHRTQGARRRCACRPSPSSVLTHFDEPWVVTAVIRRTLVSRAVTRVAPGRKLPRHAPDPDPVHPALEHGRLPAPPRRVHEHDVAAPVQLLGMCCHGGVRAGTHVRPPFLGAEPGIEPLGVQVADPHVVAARGQRLDDGVANRGRERLRVGMAVDDERVHVGQVTSASPSCARPGRGTPRARGIPVVSIEYSPSHVVAVCRPHVILSVRVSIRRPLSLISLM